MPDTTRAREAREKGVREDVGVRGRERERLERWTGAGLGDLDNRGFSMVIGTDARRLLWRRK
jgi:hypothetical protein